MTDEKHPQLGNLQSFHLHLPEGDRLYVCVVDEKRRAFDFTDNTFKSGSKLAHVRDACLPATGRHEPRADHAYSYTVEIDLARLMQGTDPATIPIDGDLVTIHWLVQAGDEPDVKVDRQCESCRLRLVSGSFEPIDRMSLEQLDENISFEKRARHEEEYRGFILREFESQDRRRAHLSVAVRDGDVGGVLRVVAEDLCYWAGNLVQHLLHHVSHLAKDPFFISMIDVPEGAPFHAVESWIVRDWIGCRDAFDLLEFHKSPEYARSFSARLDHLQHDRVEFAKHLTEYTVRTRGEDVEGFVVLDETRKELKHKALWLAEHIDRIATQFDAVRRSSPDQTPASPLPDQSAYPLPIENGEAQDPRPFTGGELVFYEDRVELCGVDICSGPRSASRRVVLELLGKRKADGESFIAYSGEDLESEAKRYGAKGTAAGSIRDLRDDIMEALRNRANIVSERKDVILSGDTGYRFAECLTVRHVSSPTITDITDMAETADVRDPDVRDVFDVRDEESARRREWILEQLGEKVPLKAPNVAEQFGRSKKTAQRDLDALRDEGLIEFVGDPRTGYYRLRQAPRADR